MPANGDTVFNVCHNLYEGVSNAGLLPRYTFYLRQNAFIIKIIFIQSCLNAVECPVIYLFIYLLKSMFRTNTFLINLP